MIHLKILPIKVQTKIQQKHVSSKYFLISEFEESEGDNLFDMYNVYKKNTIFRGKYFLRYSKSLIDSFEWSNNNVSNINDQFTRGRRQKDGFS